MKTVTFYTHVSVRDIFVCRLARTVYDKNTRLLICCEDAKAMSHLDELLWIYDDNSFLAHDSWCSHDPFPAHSPLVLTCEMDALPDNPAIPATVLNLSDGLCTLARFTRVLEIVDGSKAALTAARARFVAYRQAGFALEHHNMEDK